jgi:N-acylneuraminate cytidylyltransferase
VSCIAIIPARGGSKRIPRKNIRDFLGRPIIAYSIEAAINSGLFDEVMVSTDDEEIADVARKYGAKVPFLRSKQASDDYATTAQVLEEVIGEYSKKEQVYSFACCIYPSSPFVTKEVLTKAYDKLSREGLDSVFPVLRYSYPIWRSLKMEKGKVIMNWPEHVKSRSQDLPPAYHDSGQFYWFNVKAFSNKRALFTDNCGAIEMTELEVQDIDNESDWAMAELKYKLLHKLD